MNDTAIRGIRNREENKALINKMHFFEKKVVTLRNGVPTENNQQSEAAD